MFSACSYCSKIYETEIDVLQKTKIPILCTVAFKTPNLYTRTKKKKKVVRARTGVRRELAATVDVNVLRWFGHVERMDNERLLKKVMNAKVDWRNARGRPRFGWKKKEKKEKKGGGRQNGSCKR